MYSPYPIVRRKKKEAINIQSHGSLDIYVSGSRSLSSRSRISCNTFYGTRMKLIRNTKDCSGVTFPTLQSGHRSYIKLINTSFPRLNRFTQGRRSHPETRDLFTGSQEKDLRRYICRSWLYLSPHTHAHIFLSSTSWNRLQATERCPL